MGKDERVIHEGQVLMTVKVRRVVKTAEYENYEVVLDEVHLATEANSKNTRERLIDAMTDVIHEKVKAFEAKLRAEEEALMEERRRMWAKSIEPEPDDADHCEICKEEDHEGLPLDAEDKALRDKATEIAMHPPPEVPEGAKIVEVMASDGQGHKATVRPEGSYRGLELNPSKEPLDAPVKTDAENEDESKEGGQ
jgi:hypothetical protein